MIIIGSNHQGNLSKRIIKINIIFLFSLLVELSCIPKNYSVRKDNSVRQNYCDAIASKDSTWAEVDSFYTFVDDMPKFKGGSSEFRGFLFKNFNNAVDEGNIQLSFYTEFIINIDGKLISPRIMNKNPKEYSKAEIHLINVLKASPEWIPGKCNGIIVPVRLFQVIH